MLMISTILFLLHGIQLLDATCPLEKAAVPASNAVFDGNPFDTDNLSIKDDATFTVKCAVSNHVFVNAVRAIDDVNITSLDEDGMVKGECTVNNMIPNIFLSDTVENSYNQGTRKFYCARGCNPLKAAGQTIVYPASMLGNEANSPPIQISDENVSVTCAPKYAQAVGDAGSTEVQCKEGGANGWSVSLDKLIKCVQGCPDVRNITNGFTRAKVKGSAGNAPFTVGDIIPFQCNPGYVMVGYETLTCTSDYQWHEKPPECVLSTKSASLTYDMDSMPLFLISFLLYYT